MGRGSVGRTPPVEREALMAGKRRAAGSAEEGEARVAVNFALDGRFVVRTASAGRFASMSRMPAPADYAPTGAADGAALARIWNLMQIEGEYPRHYRGLRRPEINVVDLFCGCGGLSLGVKHAAEAVGLRPVFSLAADVAEAPLDVYRKNLRPLQAVRENVENLVDYSHRTCGNRLTPDVATLYASESLASMAGHVDIFLAGPPCEGNSNLNNRTRRFDRRNELYMDAVLAGVALDARVIVVENVPTVRRAHQGVVERSLAALHEAGYRTRDAEFVRTASDFGTPQDRRRHFLIAGKSEETVSTSDFDALKTPAPTASEALASLRGVERRGTFDRPSRLSPDNLRRVRLLVERGEYDLPDDERPDCHRLKDHTYSAVYGRMRPDRAASTITTGFLSPGRGRFTHPHEPRSLTPHEGARLQGFGEGFDWLASSERITRSEYASMIGAAVPPQLGFAVGMCALSIL